MHNIQIIDILYLYKNQHFQNSIPPLLVLFRTYIFKQKSVKVIGSSANTGVNV